MDSQFETENLAWPKDYLAKEDESSDSSNEILVSNLRLDEPETESESDVDSYDGRKHETDSDERECYPDEEDHKEKAASPSDKLAEEEEEDSETELEWDVDSYDGREHEIHPYEREYYPDEVDFQDFLRRRREALESKGFSPDYFNGIHPFGSLDAPAGKNLTNRDVLTDLADLCVQKLNEDKGKSVEIDSIVSATVSGGAKWKIYITLLAREYENGPLVEYQAKVMRYAANYKPPFPILCRPAPKPTTT